MTTYLVGAPQFSPAGDLEGFADVPTTIDGVVNLRLAEEGDPTIARNGIERRVCPVSLDDSLVNNPHFGEIHPPVNGEDSPVLIAGNGCLIYYVGDGDHTSFGAAVKPYSRTDLNHGDVLVLGGHTAAQGVARLIILEQDFRTGEQRARSDGYEVAARELVEAGNTVKDGDAQVSQKNPTVAILGSSKVAASCYQFVSSDTGGYIEAGNLIYELEDRVSRPVNQLRSRVNNGEHTSGEPGVVFYFPNSVRDASDFEDKLRALCVFSGSPRYIITESTMFVESLARSVANTGVTVVGYNPSLNGSEFSREPLFETVLSHVFGGGRERGEPLTIPSGLPHQVYTK